MVSVVALLDPEHSARVESLWRDLDQHFGLTGWRSAPWPHVPLHAARTYHDSAIRDGIKAACRGTRPFTIRTTGVRVVHLPEPVIALTVDKDAQLAGIHRALYGFFDAAARDTDPRSHPDHWTPLIPLAHHGLTESILAAVRDHLAGADLRWTIPIREVGVIVPDEGADEGARLEHLHVLNPNPNPVRVVPYDPRWRDHFVAEAAVLRDALSPHALAIAHVGSTAVPGLPAKPIIDIMVGVRSLASAPKLVQPLQTLGYRYAPEYETVMPDRRYFSKTAGSGPAIHLHMVELGSAFWERHIAFRDYLKRHPDVAAEYAALKMRLAEQHRDQRHAYTEGKTAFITAIEARALAEARGEPALLHAGHAFTERQAAE